MAECRTNLSQQRGVGMGLTICRSIVEDAVGRRVAAPRRDLSFHVACPLGQRVAIAPATPDPAEVFRRKSRFNFKGRQCDVKARIARAITIVIAM